MTTTRGVRRTAGDRKRQADRGRLRAVARGPAAVVAAPHIAEAAANPLDTMGLTNLFRKVVEMDATLRK